MPHLFPIHGPNLFSGRGLGVPMFIFGRVPLPTLKLTISGVTRDNTGAILGGCAVEIFRTQDDVKFDNTTSDAVTGVYIFNAAVLGDQYYAVAYKAGSPDVAGTTVNTIVGV